MQRDPDLQYIHVRIASVVVPDVVRVLAIFCDTFYS